MNRQFKYNEAEIFYRVHGTGLPVVLLHGVPATGDVWQNQVDLLQKSYTLIVPDLPGSGSSGLLRSENAITMNTYADCIKALLDYEGINTCIMFGHSMGGYITLAFAAQYSSYLCGFGFVHSTSFADSEARKRKRTESIEKIKAGGAAAFVEQTTPALFGINFSKHHPDTVKKFIEAGKQLNAETLQQYYMVMMNRPDRSDVLENTTLPVLFVAGAADSAVAIDDILKQSHMANNTTLHVFENAGHMSMLEEPAALGNFLMNFIDDVYA